MTTVHETMECGCVLALDDLLSHDVAKHHLGRTIEDVVERCGDPWCQWAYDQEAVHGWFSLTYANYLVVPRTLLQSMSGEWQARFVACLEELDAEMAEVKRCDYRVMAVDVDGKFTKESVPHYARGRERVGRHWDTT